MPSIETAANHTIHALELGPMENFIYLLVDENTKLAAVVDPAWDVNTIVKCAKTLKVTITDVLLTHSHHDHINGLEELLNHYDAQIHILKSEADFWEGSYAPFIFFLDKKTKQKNQAKLNSFQSNSNLAASPPPLTTIH